MCTHVLPGSSSQAKNPIREMKPRSRFFPWALAALLAMPCVKAAPSTVELIAPGVWFREGAYTPSLSCNIAVIEMRDYLIVVDASFPGQVPAIKADIARLSSKPVRYVLLTHHHGDHSYGSVLWTRAGAITLAHAEAAEEMKRLEPYRWTQGFVRHPDVAALKLEGPELPRQTFSGPLYVIDDGCRRVEFRHFGYGHSRGDSFVYLPKEQVICTGDAAVNGPYNATGDAFLANWPKELEEATRLPIRHVLPGHGAAGGIEILRGQAQFLTELYETVRLGLRRGQTLEEIQAGAHFSSAVRPWVGRPTAVKKQILDVYEEIRSGRPRGETAAARFGP